MIGFAKNGKDIITSNGKDITEIFSKVSLNFSYFFAEKSKIFC